MKSYQEAILGTFQGKDMVAYTFENDLGYRLKVMTYGATVLEYVTPDKNLEFANIVVGFDHFDAYVGNSPKYGASVGPVAGRIAIIVALLAGIVLFFKLRKSRMKASLFTPSV